MLAGQVPDPDCAVAEDGELADVAGAAAAALSGHQGPGSGGGSEGGQVAGGVRVADGVPVRIDPGLGEGAGQFHLAGAGLAVLALAGAAGGLGCPHRHAGAVDGEVQLVRQAGGRQRDQRAGADRSGPGLDDGGGGPAVGFGVPAQPLTGQPDPGQVGDQPGAGGERHRLGGPGGHRAQPG